MNFKPLAGLAALAVALFINTGLARAQEEVRLTPIEMVESKDTIDHTTQTDMERKTATNLWEAMKGTLGVYQGISATRFEGTLGIRGFRNTQIGLFIDDIPIATAYRNEWDPRNFMLMPLESIEVSKGYSSPLLASNNGLGGVLNLRTAKPTKELEFSAKYMNFFDRELDDQGRFFATGLGTKQEHFYLKATVMQNQQDFFTLPSSYKTGNQSSNEDGGRRNNSDYKNQAVNFIAGWTPTEDVDIMFGFVRQQHEKGNPPNAAPSICTGANCPGQNAGWGAAAATGISQYNLYRRWPEYETSRYYLNTNVNLDEKAHLKAVLYYDRHKDGSLRYNVSDFKDPSYSIDPNWMTTSAYDQYTAGGQLTFDYTFNEANKLAVSGGYRRLSHKAYTNSVLFDGDPRAPLDQEIVDDFYDFGAEYTLKPTDPLTLVLGAGYTYLTPKTQMNLLRYNNARVTADPSLLGAWVPITEDGAKNDGFFNYQLGAFYDLTQNHELHFTFAHKEMFPSARERYSRLSRSGGTTTLNDPANQALIGTNAAKDLKPEKAFHYELGYRGLIQDRLKINANLYYTAVKDKVASENVYFPVDESGGTNPAYYSKTINADKATFYGLELGTEALFNQYLSGGLTFNYLEWDYDVKDKTSTQTRLTGLPKYTGTAYAIIAPLEGLSIIPQVNWSSGFYWSNRYTQTTWNETGGFTTADLKVVYDLNEHLTFELGAKNITDKEYAYEAYYPEPGRSFFLGLTAVY